MKKATKKENFEYLVDYTQFDRLKELNELDLIHFKQQGNFDRIRFLRNKGAHEPSTVTIYDAYEIHRLLFKVCAWFYKQYGDAKFKIPPFKGPIYEPPEDPNKEKIQANTEKIKDHSKKIKELTEKYENLVKKLESQDLSHKPDDLPKQDLDMDSDTITIEYDTSVTDMANPEPHIKQINGSYLIWELSKLRDSSKEAVEGHKGLSSFKEYLHIKRDIQDVFMERVEEIANTDSSHLVMLCGNVGDGKSHLLAYLNSKRPDLAEKFDIYNDATESFNQYQESIDNLAEILKSFNDENLNSSNKKVIIAINLGILNNFIDSDYANTSFKNLRDILIGFNIFDSTNLSANHFTKNLIK